MVGKRALFFDLYNTLVHFDYNVLPTVELDGQIRRTTMVAVHRALSECRRLRFGVEDLLRAALDSRELLRRLQGEQHREFPSSHRFQLMSERLGIGEPDLVELMVERHMEEMFRMMYCPGGSHETLKVLARRPLFLASNFDHAPTARRALREFGLADYFQQIFISDELGWRKPGSRFFEEIVRRSGVDPSRSVFIGDDPVADIEGASRHGFTTIWLRPPGAESWPRTGPDRVIESLAELPGILEELGLEEDSG